MAKKINEKTENVKKESPKKEVVKEKFSLSNKSILIIICTILALILVAVYVKRTGDINLQNRLQTSYLINSDVVNLEIKNLEEVNQILTEAPSKYFVLITYTGNEDNYELEKGLESIITNYNLSDSFYYLNVKSIIDEDNYITRINDTFNTDKVTVVPTILYFENGEVVDIVKRADNNTINASDFQKLLDIYDYGS